MVRDSPSLGSKPVSRATAVALRWRGPDTAVVQLGGGAAATRRWLGECVVIARRWHDRIAAAVWRWCGTYEAVGQQKYGSDAGRWRCVSAAVTRR